jgi:hypothetical protein
VLTPLIAPFSLNGFSVLLPPYILKTIVCNFIKNLLLKDFVLSQ